MGPPPTGTPEWEEHLAKQRENRQRESLAKNIRKYTPIAAKKLKAADRKLEAANRRIEALRGERDALREDRDQLSRHNSNKYYEKLGVLMLHPCCLVCGRRFVFSRGERQPELSLARAKEAKEQNAELNKEIKELKSLLLISTILILLGACDALEARISSAFVLTGAAIVLLFFHPPPEAIKG